MVQNTYILFYSIWLFTLLAREILISGAIKSKKVKFNKVYAADYDEEADDRDRFKYDKFYNAAVMFGSPVVLSILLYITYLGHKMERHFDQEKYVRYPYLAVRNKVS